MQPGETRVKLLMKSSQNEGNKIFPNHLQEIWNIPLLFVKSTLLLTTKFYRSETTHPLYGTRLNSAGETFGGDCNLNFRCSEDKESCVKRDRPRGLYVNLARKRYLRRKQCSQQPWKPILRLHTGPWHQPLQALPLEGDWVWCSLGDGPTHPGGMLGWTGVRSWSCWGHW